MTLLIVGDLDTYLTLRSLAMPDAKGHSNDSSGKTPTKRKLTLAELEARIPSIPPDDPIFKMGFVVGLTKSVGLPGSPGASSQTPHSGRPSRRAESSPGSRKKKNL